MPFATVPMIAPLVLAIIRQLTLLVALAVPNVPPGVAVMVGVSAGPLGVDVFVGVFAGAAFR